MARPPRRRRLALGSRLLIGVACSPLANVTALERWSSPSAEPSKDLYHMHNSPASPSKQRFIVSLRKETNGERTAQCAVEVHRGGSAQRATGETIPPPPTRDGVETPHAPHATTAAQGSFGPVVCQHLEISSLSSPGDSPEAPDCNQ